MHDFRKNKKIYLFGSSVALLVVFLLVLTAIGCETEDETICTVTLDFDYLGQTETQSVTLNEHVQEPSSVQTKDGYSNLGWFIEENGNWRAWDFANDIVTSDMRLQYRREPCSYFMELSMNDGSEAKERVYFTYGEPYELPTPTRDGYLFLGWYQGWNQQPDGGVWLRTEDSWAMARWAVLPVGTTVSMGMYEQDDERETEGEPIEWLVINKRPDGSAYLLVSRYLLDWEPMHDRNSAVAWQNRSLRHWLNDSFYQSAFTDAEREQICMTALADVGMQDRIFLLSTDEMELLGSPEYLAGVLTPYANRKTNGYISSRGTIYGYATTAYWLRYDKKYPASYVSTIGFSGDKMSVNTMKAGVRPAMWVDAAYVDALLGK